MHMSHGGDDWEANNITVDSGAVRTVGPRSLGKGIPLLGTEASTSGTCYRAANDTKIAIHENKAVQGYIPARPQIGIDIQIADVKKALGSVRRMCEAGIE